MYSVLGKNNEVLGSIEKIEETVLNEYYNKIKKTHEGKLKNEFFEILDGEGEKTGKLKLRDFVHKDGDWHGAFHLHIYSRLDSENFLLMQKRKYDKDICPNVFGTMASGHYMAGESIEGGLREIKEEIGLDVKLEDLILLGKRKIHDFQKEKGIIDSEFMDVAVYECNRSLDFYNLQKSELSGIVKIKINEFIDLMMDKRIDICEVESRLFNDAGNLETKFLSIRRSDIYPAIIDNYYLKTAIIISKMIRNEKLPENPYKYDVMALL